MRPEFMELRRALAPRAVENTTAVFVLARHSTTMPAGFASGTATSGTVETHPTINIETAATIQIAAFEGRMIPA